MVSWINCFLLLSVCLSFIEIVCGVDVDIIVYGSTAAGVFAAIAAAGEGMSVALLDPRNFTGGMVAGGLSVTDIGTTTAVIGGRTLAFFKEIGAHYNSTEPVWNFEPKVASAIFSSWLSSASSVQVALNTRLVQGFKDTGTGRLLWAVDAAGVNHTASVWIDCSYEGWLLPLANVSHTWGRESAATYNESAAGVIPSPYVPNKNYTVQPNLFESVNPYWNNGTLIPLVGSPPAGPPGSGDARMQAYNVRWTGTNVASNMRSFASLSPPEGYDARIFEIYRRLLVARQGEGGGGCGTVGGGSLPNGKWDNNDQLTDFVGLNWDYPAAISNGSWVAQTALWELHLRQTWGYLYYLAHDPGVPSAVRQCMAGLGFPLDEFVDHDNFPPQVYVREALRMVGDFIFTQIDREIAVNKTDCIGMGAYTVDTMHASRYGANFSTGNGIYQVGTLMEGGLQAPSFLTPGLSPFQIPYRALLPKATEATNLLVPVAVSASHIGFGAIRLEPTWMTLGESAGVAAAQAVKQASRVQDIDISALQARLQSLGQVLSL